MTDLYQSQRAMRHMRRTAMQRGVVAILDVGTSKIACLVLRFDGFEQMRDIDGVGPMAGQSTFRVIGAATTRSRGVRFGDLRSPVLCCGSTGSSRCAILMAWGRWQGNPPSA